MEHFNISQRILSDVEFVHYFFHIFKLHLFARYSKIITDLSDMDNTSIMFYPILTQFRLNRQAMRGTNYNISVDKRFIKEEYPQSYSDVPLEGFGFLCNAMRIKKNISIWILTVFDLKSRQFVIKKPKYILLITFVMCQFSYTASIMTRRLKPIES